MSKLLGMSFDAAASPLMTLLYTRADRADRQRPYGWGMAWYAASDRAATVVKDPAASSDGASTQLLRDWTRFRSTVFVGHLRGAAARISQENTHPFARSHAGRDWVMTHHGQLDAGFAAALPLGDRPAFEPVGRTDTEHVLCWLLQRCREHDIDRLAEIGWERLHAWLGEANQVGTFNMLISDGSHLVAYQDQGGHAPMHWTRRCPPHAATLLTGDDVELDLGGVRDRSRTAVLVSTDQLADAGDEPGNWQRMTPGQMLAICRGAVLWDSATAPATADVALPSAVPPSSVPPSSILGEAAAAPAAGPVGPLDLPAEAGLAPTLQQQTAAPAAVNDPPPTGPGAAPEGEAAANGPDPTLTSADSPTAPGAPSAPSPDAAPSPTDSVRVYDVLHATRYEYETPVEFSRHVLRVRPVHDRFQEVLSYDLDIEPLTAQFEHEDVFGNFATRIEIEGSAPKMAFVARSRVRVHAMPVGELRSPHRRTSVPLSWMPWQRQMMLPYLLPMELPESQLQELFDYAMSFVERQDYDIVETLLDINTSIYRDYAYVQGITSVETTPFEVYTTRRGVCQDFANLLICLARLLNVPARYRVGYIYTGGNYENKLQSDASHAWVEVFLPWLGWKGLDPTNGCIVDHDHIRVASGRHFRDATPTSGTIYRGGGGEKLEIEVRVTPVIDGHV